VHNKGFIFRLATDGTFTKTYEFADYSGSIGAFIQASNGKLMTIIIESGVQKLFSVNLDGTSPQTFTISGLAASSSLNEILMQGADGKLYGSLYQGVGAGNYVLFRMNADGTGYTELHSFGTSRLETDMAMNGDQIYGNARLPFSAVGNYIFKIKTDGTGFGVLHTATPDGYQAGGLCLGANNTLFAANELNDVDQYGNIIKVKTDGTGYAIIKGFYTKTDGTLPVMRLSAQANGELIGVAAVRGSASSDPWNSGVMFKIGTDNSYHVLFEFDGVTTGGEPIDPPVPGPGG